MEILRPETKEKKKKWNQIRINSVLFKSGYLIKVSLPPQFIGFSSFKKKYGLLNTLKTTQIKLINDCILSDDLLFVLSNCQLLMLHVKTKQKQKQKKKKKWMKKISVEEKKIFSKQRCIIYFSYVSIGKVFCKCATCQTVCYFLSIAWTVTA